MKLVTHETRRAMFRAQVVAIASGEHEVSARRIAAAVLQTPEMRSFCDRAGISVDAVVARVDGDSERPFADVLASVEASLAARGEQFGSQAHILSLQPRPLGENTRRALVDATETSTRGALTPVDVLLAVLLSDSDLAEDLASGGLTADVLRSNGV